MIAIVSSTVAPSRLPNYDGARTTLSPEVRLEQTRGTVASLVAIGAREIVVADNSPGDWLRERVSALSPARVLHMAQPPIRNKGIGELWLLLGALDALAENEPILKISGRYRVGPATQLVLQETDDIVARVYQSGASAEISTRCYLMRSRAVATALWSRSLDELYAQPSRIVGPRSLLRIIGNSILPLRDDFPYSDPNTSSVERAAMRAIRHLRLRFRPVDTLDVEGVIGGTGNLPIRE